LTVHHQPDADDDSDNDDDDDDDDLASETDNAASPGRALRCDATS